MEYIEPYSSQAPYMIAIGMPHILCVHHACPHYDMGHLQQSKHVIVDDSNFVLCLPNVINGQQVYVEPHYTEPPCSCLC